MARLDSAPAPFVKWAGGKRMLLDVIIPFIPTLAPKARYYEPFLGGGAVFFALEPKQATLSDANTELVETYCAVRDDVEQVIEAMKRLKFDEDHYYQVRASRPRTDHTKAARFIFLNKTCFNGLYRVNLKGEFNVPFGRHPKNHVVCDTDQLRAASKALQRAKITCVDFAESMTKAKAGDVVYCDPPYTTSHSKNGFIEYNAKVFAWPDQHRLADTAIALAREGVHVVISNGDHPSITRLYEKSGAFTIHPIERWSTMAGSALRRRKTTELVLVSKEPA